MRSKYEPIDIPDGYMYSMRLGKVRRFIRDWRQGRQNDFPICCVFRFSLESAADDGKLTPIKNAPGEKRGCVQREGTDDVFVPCNIFHHRNDEDEENLNLGY